MVDCMVVKRWTIVLFLVCTAVAWCVTAYFTMKQNDKMIKLMNAMPNGAPFQMPLPFPQKSKSNSAKGKNTATVDPNEGAQDFQDISKDLMRKDKRQLLINTVAQVVIDLFGLIAVGCCGNCCCVLLFFVAITGGTVYWTWQVIEKDLHGLAWVPLGLSIGIIFLVLLYLTGNCIQSRRAATESSKKPSKKSTQNKGKTRTNAKKKGVNKRKR